MLRRIRETAEFLKGRGISAPDTGIVLGTGLGRLAEEIEVEEVAGYGDIPHFPLSTVEFHSGKLIYGKLCGKQVLAMQGRFHFYEGYSFQQIVFPVRVMKKLGIHTLIVSNAAGGLNPNFAPGDIMLIRDHINFFPGNPLVGPDNSEWGPRFPDMYEVYNHRYLQLAKDIALEQRLQLQEGVYVAVTGPCLETAAEYRMFRGFGADAVGMSTIPEVIAAHHQGNKILGFSIITDMGLPDNMHPCSLEKVIAIAGEAEPKLRDLIAGCVERM